MKALLWILGVVALVLLVAGAVNHTTQLSLDYVVGTTPAFSVFWVALTAAAALLLAAVLGWVIGKGAGFGARAKLERELESTYRRLRDCEARLPRAAAPAEAPAVVVPALDESPTAVIAAADEAQTAVAPAADAPSGDARAAGDAPPGGDASPRGGDAAP